MPRPDSLLAVERENNVCKQISYVWIFQHKVGTGDMPGKKIMWFIGVDSKLGAPLPKKILFVYNRCGRLTI